VYVPVVQMLRISLLCGVLLVGCADGRGKTAQLHLAQEASQYVTFGSAVLCRSTDRACLRQLFNRCLGETQKKHYFESGPPDRAAVLPSGEAVAEWVVGGSSDRIIMTYDQGGVARRWQYRAVWGVIQSENASITTRDSELSASLMTIVHKFYKP
jgi:hypothetical protein